jgi:uncharacterized protein
MVAECRHCSENPNAYIHGTMSGEKDLDILLKNMSPRLNEGEFVFCCLPDPASMDPASIIGTFREAEGTTVILPRQKADELGLSYAYVSAWITLTVHSALDAVGLTAAFSAALAREGISCNVIAGYHHDHLFVGVDDAARAVAALRGISGK